MMERRRMLLMDSIKEFTVTGNPAVFNTNIVKPLKNMLIPFNPIQASGTPSPDNPLPITGWTGCNVTRTGKNLFDKSKTDTNNGFVENYYLNGTDGTENGSYNYNISEYIPVKGNVDYVISAISGFNPGYIIYNGSKEKIAYANYNFLSSITFTTPANAQYIRISIPKANIDSIQLELGSSASSYEPYDGDTYSISWQTEAGTVYGGNLEVMADGNCKLTVEKAYAPLNDKTKWIATTGNVSFTYNETFNDRKIFADSFSGLITTMFPVMSINNAPFMRWEAASSKKVGIKDPTNTMSLQDVQNISESGNLSICYELATPIEYDIAPITINTLLGDNTIFSDTNGINTISYLKR